MKLVFRLFVVIISFVVSVLANGNLKHPFLWEVTKDKQHFYLFGTMHLADPDLQILPEMLTDIITSSDTIYTEITMDFATQIKAVKYIMRKDKKTLKEILPPKLYAASERYVKSINSALTLAPFEQMKVWGLSTTLMMLKYELKYPTMRPIDKVIYDYARSKHKRVAGIEQIGEQLSIMDSFTQQEQIESLESTLAYLNGSRDVIGELKKHYLEGDSQKTLTFLDSMMFDMPKYKALEEKFMQRLLYDRNAKMAERIHKISTLNPEKQYLFAFGVMHFLGVKSVIEHLEDYGYTVKRLK